MARTIKLYGLGYSTTSADATVTVKLDGTQVFQGPVTTNKVEPFDPRGSAWVDDGVVWSWEEDLAPVTRRLEIICNTGAFIYTRTFCNFMPVALKTNTGDVYSSGANGWLPCYYEVHPQGFYRDPNTNVEIDDQPQTAVSIDGGLNLGQWYWPLRQGQELVCDLRISQGLETPVMPGVWDDSLNSYLVWNQEHQNLPQPDYLPRPF